MSRDGRRDLFAPLVRTERVGIPPSPRPVDYDPAIAAEVLDRVANGASLRRIGVDPLMPVKRTWYRWMAEHPDLRKRFDEARQQRAEALADDTIEIADDDPDPQRARVRVNARQWLAGRLAPQAYGDKLDVQQTLTVDAAGMLETARRVAFLLNSGAKQLQHGRTIENDDESEGS